MKKAEEKFKSIGFEYQKRSYGNLFPDSIVINVLRSACLHDCGMQEVDELLSEKDGTGIQICVMSDPITEFESYAHMLDGTKSTCFVSAGMYQNAAQIAAQFIGIESFLGYIKKEKAKKARSLDDHNGLIIKAGEVEKL